MSNLNIDYEAITGKAQARAARLREVENNLVDLSHYTEQLGDALEYFIDLGSQAETLDLEGRELLGDVYRRIQGVTGQCEIFRYSVFKPLPNSNGSAPFTSVLGLAVAILGDEAP